MKLKRLRRRSGGVIDRRGQAGPGGFGSGSWGGGGLPIPVGGGVGIVVFVLILLAVFVLPRIFGQDDGLGGALSPFDDTAPVQPGTASINVGPKDELERFVDAVTDDIQTTWAGVFDRAGLEYEPTSIVLFDGATTSGCGRATAATGPFYCPGDRLVYLEEGFFRELERRFGPPGDFAEAYVIAHEVGHHVQTLLGIERKVRQTTAEDAPTVVWTPSPPGYRGHPTRPYLTRVERENPVKVHDAFGHGGKPTVRRAELRGGNRTPKKRMPAAERRQEIGTR